jgi:hypothetical protein
MHIEFDSSCSCNLLHDGNTTYNLPYQLLCVYPELVGRAKVPGPVYCGAARCSPGAGITNGALANPWLRPVQIRA